MKKLIVRIFVIVFFAAIIAFSRIAAYNFNNYKQSALKYMPRNNVSNSGSFKAKIDHIARAENFRHCSFLIAGSSMSLNNISGCTVYNRTKENVYNISSWGFKPGQLNEFLKLIKLDSIKYLLVAFNNCDFGKESYNIDYKAVDALINGNILSRNWSFLYTFNISTFSKDWDYRCDFSTGNHYYQSLNFDEYGSVLLNRKGFQINNKRWNTYYDSTGFNYFFSSVSNLYTTCNKHKVKLILAYLPDRPNLATERNVLQNRYISKVLKTYFGDSFIDLRNINIPLSEYCDGSHLYKEGAELLTNLIIDSLQMGK